MLKMMKRKMPKDMTVSKVMKLRLLNVGNVFLLNMEILNLLNVLEKIYDNSEMITPQIEKIIQLLFEEGYELCIDLLFTY